MSKHITLGADATGPLAGIRVADFSAVFSGPICAAMLGDQGADVIKIEAFTGDMMRRGLPQSNGMGSAFTTMNRNKRSLCLNCLLYTSPSPRDVEESRMPSSA